MRAAVCLAALLGLTALVERAVGLLPPGEPGQQARIALTVGVLMLGGWLSGRLIEHVKLPAITGYLIYGMVVGPSLLGIIPAAQIQPTDGGYAPMRFANDLAVSLIALLAGGEIHLGWLKGRAGKILLILAVHMAVLFAGVGLVIVAAKPLVPFLADVGWTTTFVIAALASVVMLAKSPAVTVAMISDYRADGPLCQTSLMITVFKDLVLIVLFATVMAISQGVLDPAHDVSPGFLLGVGFQLIGSVVLGAVIGGLMSWYVERLAAHLAIFVLGCCLLIAVIGEQELVMLGHHVHLEPLLMALSAGLWMRNARPRRTAPLFHTMEVMSLPVFCLFFALAGARVDLAVFATLWPLSLGLVLVRGLATWGGIRLGLGMTQLEGEWTRYLWLGMISQAGVSLVLVTIIASTFQDAWAVPLKEALIGAIIINQLFGPIGFRWALLRSGEAWQGQRRRGGDRAPSDATPLPTSANPSA